MPDCFAWASSEPIGESADLNFFGADFCPEMET
jgi:hypothetical protein